MAQAGAKTQTPVMRQYLAAKSEHPDALLFFRMGDFYELFFDDAVVTARALDLKLTSRDRNDPDPTPMCGVPHHAVQSYIARLLEMGHHVAICEQLEDPAHAKGIVKRGVVRVLTPALVLDGDALAPRANQFLAAVVRAADLGDAPPARRDLGSIAASPARGELGLAAFDLSTGEVFTTTVSDTAQLLGDLARLDPRELIVARDAESDMRALVRVLPRMFVRGIDATVSAAATDNADGTLVLPDSLAPLARAAARLAIAYARTTQPGQDIVVHRVVPLDPASHLALDETTQFHLELFRTTRGERRGSLLAQVDETVTPMGARRLRSWIAYPSTDIRTIRERHDGVEVLWEKTDQRAAIRTLLGAMSDVERVAMRAALHACSPRDLGELRDSLDRVPELVRCVESLGARAKAVRMTDECAELRERLRAAVVDAPPITATDGGVIRPGFDAELDELTTLATGGRTAIASLEQSYRDRTKIASLKIGYNRIFGYYIEVTKPNLKNVPDDFKRKQTVATGERFITEELYELEQKILHADERRLALEQERFAQLVADVARSVTPLCRLASRVAELDTLAGFAEAARRHDYVRPTVDDSGVIELRDARHPVVERVLDPGAFVPNDTVLDTRGERLLLITGPNMAGKSTLMRQTALIVLLAQAGSFVPARSARIGVVDRIFTRVGASDDLSRGASTFMVEMRESASILRHATTRSLVLFDEIGRGTSTFDGLAIAWSVAEYLHDVVRARAMFATHYHEMCSLAETRKHVANYNVSARESGEDIVFLHKLQAGGASRSYGIAVARLAGLPEPVLARARALLKDLERGEGPGAAQRQLGLFEPRPEAPQHPVLSALANADTDRMTPIDALNFLTQLRALSGRPEE